MDAKRLWQTFRLCLCKGAVRRAEYLKRCHVFHSIGENCSYMPRRVPLYPNLIKFGDYVRVASNVYFFAHDGMQKMFAKDDPFLEGKIKDNSIKEGLGCIEIGNHVFIAANSSITYNVKIGNYVVITAGSVVCSDIPSDCVVRGNPAKVVCSLTDYVRMRALKTGYRDELDHRMGRYVGKELEEWLWSDFEKSRDK